MKLMKPIIAGACFMSAGILWADLASADGPNYAISDPVVTPPEDSCVRLRPIWREGSCGGLAAGGSMADFTFTVIEKVKEPKKRPTPPVVKPTPPKCEECTPRPPKKPHNPDRVKPTPPEGGWGANRPEGWKPKNWCPPEGKKHDKSKDNASEHNGKGGNDGKGGKPRDGGKNKGRGR